MENHNEKEPQNLSADRRNKIIVRTSVIGILANVLLAAAKAVIGFAANSIAVILDAVNNISKAGIDMMKETLDDILGVRILTEEIGAAYPGYAVLVAPDVDISD